AHRRPALRARQCVRANNIGVSGQTLGVCMTALRGMRVVELAEGVSGEYCGKLLADFCAEIVKVERIRAGSPTRSMAPIVGHDGGVERSALFAYLNTNKESVELDLASSAGLDALRT